MQYAVTWPQRINYFFHTGGLNVKIFTTDIVPNEDVAKDLEGNVPSQVYF